MDVFLKGGRISLSMGRYACFWNAKRHRRTFATAEHARRYHSGISASSPVVFPWVRVGEDDRGGVVGVVQHSFDIGKRKGVVRREQ